MKVLVAAIAAGVGLLALAAVLLNPQNVSRTGENPGQSPPAMKAPAPAPEAAAVKNRQPLRAVARASESSPLPASASVNPASSSTATATGLPAASDALYRQAIDALVSPGATFAQRQGAWKQLKDSGRLDQAIGELERSMAANPQSAAYPAELGQAYLQKAGAIQDVREQGILAMKADQVFDAALNLDPANWEARFTKAVALSYWPTQMNKGTEVMQHFSTLIEQQEAQAAQPQFAQSYLWLGKEYAKYGYNENAKAIWQRGAALFPGDKELRAKLAAQ